VSGPICGNSFSHRATGAGHNLVALVSPSLAFREQVLAMTAEFAQCGGIVCDLQEMCADFAGYVRRLEEMSRGENLRAGWVPFHTYWLLRGGTTIVGRSNLRHNLTPSLEDVGGHIG